MKIKDYKELNIWKKGIELVDQIYCMTEKYPNHETYGLISQTRRAAVSIPTNIAEGFGRHYTNEYKQFLRISLGSCAELETLLIIAEKRKLISNDTIKGLSEIINHETRMIISLINKLK